MDEATGVPEVTICEGVDIVTFGSRVGRFVVLAVNEIDVAHRAVVFAEDARLVLELDGKVPKVFAVEDGDCLGADEVVDC